MIRSVRAILGLMALVLAMGVTAGCSSSEEESSSGSSVDACKEQCMTLPEVNQDECLIACEA